MHTFLQKTHPLYPPLLKEISDPPEKLFCRGQKLNPEDRYFAIVGTRHPTPYGQEMAEFFASSLARRGFVIVSGLAYGIDAIAHRAALDAGGRTIAVLGSGLNHITPHCNRKLAEDIQKNGTIITEFEADVPPQKHTFPQRNRIIAGMSHATLVIEAPYRSGALITARFALEYNRDVFALPGNITQETSQGTNTLIRKGEAYPATSVEDILEYIQIAHGIENNTSAKMTGKGRAENAAAASNGLRLPLNFNLNKDEETIYRLIKKSPLLIDELVAASGFPASQINTLLSLLELKGAIIVQNGYAFVTR